MLCNNILGVMLKQQRYGKEKNPEGLHSNSSTPSGLKYADISFQQQWVTKSNPVSNDLQCWIQNEIKTYH